MVLEAGGGFGARQQVKGGVADDRHVRRCIAAAQPRQILVEDDIEHPVQTVLDPPMRSDDPAEHRRAERC
jgi:hypothetical protein